jgi:RNA polymerase sigma factor (sigma-70 family)
VSLPRPQPSVAAPVPPCIADPADRSRWFHEEVQAHESALRAYLRRQFPTLTDADDVVQESYLRLWRAPDHDKIASAKAYLFAIARNLTLGRFRRQKASPEVPVVDFGSLRVLRDETDVVESVSTNQELALAEAAMESLPARCREVLMLRSLQGLSCEEIAEKLGISEATVRTQMAKGLKRCIEYFRERGITKP